MFTLNCRGKLILIEQPLVMGILNATPDSFYSGHLPDGTGGMLARAGEMISADVDILDIGGQSTRPGSTRITAVEELQRVLPVITAIHHQFPETILSIDTYYSEVAKASVEAGAHIVNDISGGNMDEKMLSVVAGLTVPYICMHMKGTPETMQKNPQYENILTEMLDFFIRKLQECRLAGIRDIIIDPGFGFGKNTEQNFYQLKNLVKFSLLGRPILTGLSRKNTIYKTLGITANEALNGTTVMNTIALLNGASILRVHDVKEAREVITLVKAYRKSAL